MQTGIPAIAKDGVSRLTVIFVSYCLVFSIGCQRGITITVVVGLNGLQRRTRAWNHAYKVRVSLGIITAASQRTDRKGPVV